MLVDVPIKSLELLSTLSASAPPSANPIVSALGKNTPVLESPLGLIDGAAVLPAATTIPPENVEIPLVLILISGPTPASII